MKATIEANATPTKATKAPKKKKKSTDNDDDEDDEDIDEKPSKKAKKAITSLGTLNEEGDNEGEGSGVVDPIRVKYQNMKNDDLKDYCRWNNLNITGTKV